MRGYRNEDGTTYTVTSFDGYGICVQFLPAESDSDKFVILSHGYSYNRHGSVKYTHLFRELGYHCIIYDMRGHGNNRRYHCSFGINEARDLIRIIEDTYQRYPNCRFLALHGESMGAATQMMAMKYHPNVDMIISDCGYADLSEMLSDKMKSLHFPPLVFRTVMFLSKHIFRMDYAKIKPYESLTENEVPLCLIHGDSDNLIPCKHAYELRKADQGYCELHLFSGADHAQSFYTDEKRYLQIVKNFENTVTINIHQQK